MDIKIFPAFHDGMSARVQLDDGDFFTWFNVCQGLRQGCVLPPLVLNLLFATAIIIAALQSFAVTSLIVLELVYLDDLPKDKDGPGNSLEIVRLEVWEMWYADVNIDACQELGLITSEKKTEAIHMRPKPSTALNT